MVATRLNVASITNRYVYQKLFDKNIVKYTRQKIFAGLINVLPTYFLRKAAKALVKTCWSTSLTPTDVQAGAILKINLD